MPDIEEEQTPEIPPKDVKKDTSTIHANPPNTPNEVEMDSGEDQKDQ